MALLSKGRLRGDYPTLGSFMLRYLTILMSEDTEFVFLSEDESEILIAEVNEVESELLKQGYGTNGELPIVSVGGGIIRKWYKSEGTYEREEL